jgi:formate dehydrogenase major subunit
MGTLKVKALVTDRVSSNQVFLPLTSQEGPVNILTGPDLDAAVFTPAYKETAVRIQVLPEQGTNPVTKMSFRYSGKRTPQTPQPFEVVRQKRGIDKLSVCA